MIPLVGVQIIGAALFQALGKAFPAMVLTLSRQITVSCAPGFGSAEN
jgi:Na+-driven multidrug efflux pump